MSTRSIIAEPYGDGWRGRYCHWDGHPKTKVPQFVELVLRDGVETVRSVIIHKHYSWSQINPAYKPDPTTQFEIVDGYGEAHNDGEVHWFTHLETELAWAEYVYILGDKELFVFGVSADLLSPNKLVPMGSHRYNEFTFIATKLARA